MHTSRGRLIARERYKKGWSPFCFTECINMKLEERFSLSTIVSSLHIECDLYIILYKRSQFEIYTSSVYINHNTVNSKHEYNGNGI